jgi:proline iminopeptidase
VRTFIPAAFGGPRVVNSAPGTKKVVGSVDDGFSSKGAAMMREQYIETSRGRIWTGVFGEEKQGIPLLVIHGGPGFMSLTDVVSDLGAERPVCFYDQLGSGNSDKAADPNDYSVDGFVEELDEVRNRLGLVEVVLMGFSWGCALAVSYVLQKKPSGIIGLILSGPLLSTPLWDKDQRDNIRTMPQEVIDAIEDGEKNQDFGDAYQAAMMAYYGKYVCRLDPWPPSLMDAFGKLNMDVYRTMWGPSEFTISGKLRGFDVSPRLGELTMPVLLTCGDFDEAGVKTLKDFQLSMTHAYLAVVPHATHLHHLEQPEIYKAVVGAFLSECLEAHR